MLTPAQDIKPTKADKFAFGLWTVGWQARDPFGDATRRALDPVESLERLSELGAWGVSFHDDDLVAFDADDSARRARFDEWKSALDRTGMVTSMMTTNLFTHPVFKDGAFTSNDRDVRRLAIAKTRRNVDYAAELGVPTYVSVSTSSIRATTCASLSNLSPMSHAETSCSQPSVTPLPSSINCSTPTWWA